MFQGGIRISRRTRRSKPCQSVSSFNSPGLAGSMPDDSLFTVAKAGFEKKVRRTSSPSQGGHSVHTIDLNPVVAGIVSLPVYPWLGFSNPL